MKHIFRSLIALAYLASAATAQAGFVINSFWGAATISLVGCTADGVSATTFTFTDHATGTAGARKTIVGVSSNDGATNFSTSTMTVGGVSATEIIDSANTGSLVQSSIYIIDNPSGTTATIVVTMSEAVEGAAICVWAAYNISSETATATASEFQTSSAAITLSLNINSGGVGVGMSAVQENGAATVTWTGMTESSEAIIKDAVGTASDGSYSSAQTTTAGTPLSVTADWVSTTDSIGVSASFR